MARGSSATIFLRSDVNCDDGTLSGAGGEEDLAVGSEADIANGAAGVDAVVLASGGMKQFHAAVFAGRGGDIAVIGHIQRDRVRRPA